jgi:Domain of unknown function (DUF4177)
MTIWEYKVETVKGVFWLRSRKLPEVRRICNELGEQGWELVDVSYDWFVVQYVLFFKREKRV